MIPVIPRITWLEAAMMGRQTGDQASLFYEFRLEDRIPRDHLLRRINVVVGPVMDGVSPESSHCLPHFMSTCPNITVAFSFDF